MIRKLFYIDDRPLKKMIKEAIENRDALTVARGMRDLGASINEINEMMGYLKRLIKSNSVRRATSIIDMRYKDFSPRAWWFLATLPLRVVFVRK